MNEPEDTIKTLIQDGDLTKSGDKLLFNPYNQENIEITLNDVQSILSSYGITAKVNNLDHVLIVEDDILFINPTKFVEQFNKFLSRNKVFDVCLIAGNNIPPYQTIDDSCIKVTKCQTTTGYLVLNHYYDTLINNYKEGISRLIREPDKHINFAIDKWWFNIQAIHNWYLITPLTVTQREDYSDIEKRSTNYSHLMLDLNKEAFFKAQAKANKYKPKLNIFN